MKEVRSVGRRVGMYVDLKKNHFLGRSVLVLVGIL